MVSFILSMDSLSGFTSCSMVKCPDFEISSLRCLSISLVTFFACSINPFEMSSKCAFSSSIAFLCVSSFSCFIFSKRFSPASLSAAIACADRSFSCWSWRVASSFTSAMRLSASALDAASCCSALLRTSVTLAFSAFSSLCSTATRISRPAFDSPSSLARLANAIREAMYPIATPRAAQMIATAIIIKTPLEI